MQIKEQKHDFAFIRHPYDSDLGRGASITVGHLPTWCEPQDIPAFLRMQPGFELNEDEQFKLVHHLERRPPKQQDLARAHGSVVRAAVVFLHGEGLLDTNSSTRLEQVRAVEREVQRLRPWAHSERREAPASIAQEGKQTQEAERPVSATPAPVTSGPAVAAVPVVPATISAPQHPDRHRQRDRGAVAVWRCGCGLVRRACDALVAWAPRQWAAGYTQWRRRVAPYV